MKKRLGLSFTRAGLASKSKIQEELVE